MPKDQLTAEERAAYDDYLAHGGEVIYLPPAPMVEEPEWMDHLEDVYGVPILDDLGDGYPTPAKPQDGARPYIPRHKSEQEWRDTWR